MTGDERPWQVEARDFAKSRGSDGLEAATDLGKAVVGTRLLL